MSEAQQLYLDDLDVGQRFTSGSYLMEAARIKEFAAEFDPPAVPSRPSGGGGERF